MENALFYLDNTRMLYGDGQEVAGKLIQEVKQL
ncbi:MAG: NAD(P)(+) transhydrogenase (Re/Si-specific) subunit beta [Gammaproteobacteria bacterium]|nr:NAD(P)(+) transhydrogenase (Re/Si-specific) subunit beta [Gammaproteobacteria bacterium]